MMSRLSVSINTVILSCAMTLLVACNANDSKKDSSSSSCPQLRTTEFAPAWLASKTNPVTSNVEKGENLYTDTPTSVPCSDCHGSKGSGDGVMASMFSPAPRNFTCSETMSEISDGQLFWIIKHGSIGTSMPAFDKLSDENIWQLVHYVRALNINSANKKG